jgi:hypothetical protein
MSAVLNGSIASGGKVLRKSQSSTEVDGLVTLTETYTIRTQDIESIEPGRNTAHSSFSTATNKYSRMLVETTRVEPMDGGLAQLLVTYVGLDYASGLPPAYITAVGQQGVGVFGADASVLVKYITQQSVFELLQGSSVNLNLGTINLTSPTGRGFTTVSGTARVALPTKRLMPSSINGTGLPPNPRAREYRGVLFGSTFTEWVYAGYVQTGISFERRGSFNRIEEQFTEYFEGSDVYYLADGRINTQRAIATLGQSFFF